ncbi:hypothetical protein ABVK25_008711 [Lepraria finkii]|uniref:Uncharacterized protein n=1 Tax=Lepraria finkii TaxID=1340010 RepID=A0ABR4AZQ5_9LECA
MDRVSRTSSGLAPKQAKREKPTSTKHQERTSLGWGARAVAYGSFLRCYSRSADSAMSTRPRSQMPIFAFCCQARRGSACVRCEVFRIALQYICKFWKGAAEEKLIQTDRLFGCLEGT